MVLKSSHCFYTNQAAIFRSSTVVRPSVFCSAAAVFRILTLKTGGQTLFEQDGRCCIYILLTKVLNSPRTRPSGSVKVDYPLLRQISSICNQLPTMDGAQFSEEFMRVRVCHDHDHFLTCVAKFMLASPVGLRESIANGLMSRSTRGKRLTYPGRTNVYV